VCLHDFVLNCVGEKGEPAIIPEDFFKYEVAGITGRPGPPGPPGVYSIPCFNAVINYNSIREYDKFTCTKPINIYLFNILQMLLQVPQVHQDYQVHFKFCKESSVQAYNNR